MEDEEVNREQESPAFIKESVPYNEKEEVSSDLPNL